MTDLNKLKSLTEMLNEKTLNIDNDLLSIDCWDGYIEYLSDDHLIILGRATALKEKACFDYHVHEESFEMFFVEKGSVEITVDGKSHILNQDNPTLTVLPNQVHNTISLEKGTELIFIEIPADKAFLNL